MGWLEQVGQDVRFGARNLARSRGVTVVAVLSLALGIMSATAMYSVIHAVVLDPFPYRDVDSLMSVKVWEPGQRGYRTYYSTDHYLEIAERSTIFDGVIASTISDVEWTGSGEPQRLRGNHVTTNTFDVMGVPPLRGRAITPADGGPGAQPVVVLGYRFWQRQFGGEAGVLGGQLVLNGVSRTVVGIMPKRFMWRGADVYIPTVYQRGVVVEGVRMVHVLGRLKPGVTDARAEADLRPVIEELRRREPAQFPEKFRVGLLSFKETFPSAIREGLWILFGAVGLLLLIACANVSNLLVAKATGRQREMAVRAALGANRGRIVRQLLTESLVLALAGGGLGVALAFGSLKALLALVPPGRIPDESEIVINIPVLLFSLGISALTALLFGLAPALHACTANLANPLRESSRALAGGLRRTLVRNGLVVAELALSLILLVGASLMIRTLIAMQSAQIDFRTDRLLTLRIPMSAQRYSNAARRTAFLEELMRRLDRTPGVEAAALNTGMHPFGSWGAPVEVIGSAQRDTRRVNVREVNSGYTRALGIGLAKGRLFTETDLAARARLALVNQAFVRRYLSDGEPLGRLVKMPRFEQAGGAFQIVGVVRDTLNSGLTEAVQPEMFVPFTIAGRAESLAVLTSGPPAAAANAVRQQVYAIDSGQPVMNVRTMEQVLDEWVFAEPRFNLVLFSVFAALGLALAVIGVYGLMSHTVSQQTQEIGVRIALGARFGDIAGMVMGRGVKLLVTGIALGLAGSFATARLLEQQLRQVSPFDPISFTAVSVVLLAAGLQACYWPARRAARVDPIAALRYE